MSDLKFDVNDNNDIVIENNKLVLVEGQDEIRQLLLERLRTFLGEWMLDTSLGISYFENIFKKRVNVNIITSIFKKAIRGTPGILELTQFELDFTGSARLLDIAFRARTQAGILIFNEAL